MAIFVLGVTHCSISVLYFTQLLGCKEELLVSSLQNKTIEANKEKVKFNFA